jgi:hypothetical protein|tara:strand:- start:124 stop:387 length:264 start_codon:yes stop_codon:yes gene_type:complete
MIRLAANYGTFGLWIMSIKDTAVSIVEGGNIDTIQLVLSILGGIYTIVIIVNKVLDGLINRKKTRLENERIMRDIWEQDENLDERYK